MDDESYDNDDDYKYEMGNNVGSSPDNSDVEPSVNGRKQLVEACFQ